MKKNALLRFALIGLVGVAIHDAHGGSAVAWDGKGHFSTAYGGPVQREKQRALASAHRDGWTPAKIIAATDSPGYGAIAVALHPNGYGSVNGIAIGRRSATEADAVAIKLCLRAGGHESQSSVGLERINSTCSSWAKLPPEELRADIEFARLGSRF